MKKKGESKRESPEASGGGIAAKLLKMQHQMRKTRADLAGETVTATAVDGAVTVVVSGDQRVQEIRILQELFFGLFSGTTEDKWGWLEPAEESTGASKSAAG